MCYFGVVISNLDETPNGRASAALRAQLPALFTEHGFEFLGPRELKEAGASQVDLFHVLAAEVRATGNNQLMGEVATFELTMAIQAAVDKIVAATNGRFLN